MSTSSRAATENSVEWRVASRSSSSPWTFCGSVIAIRSVLPSNANGIAHTRSSTGSGISFAASAFDALDREVDERQVVLLGEVARDAERVREALVEQRARERAALRARAHGLELVGRQQAAVADELARSRSLGSSPPSAARERIAGSPTSELGRPPARRAAARGAASGLLVGHDRPPSTATPGRRRGCASPAKRRDDAAEREERPERDLHLPRRLAVAGEQHDRRHERGDHPDHHRDRNGAPEHEAEQQRELDVAHPHPAGIGERGEEEEERGAEPGDQPTRATGRSAVCATSTIAGGRQDDPVRDDEALDVDHRDRDEHGAEERGDRGLEREPEDEDAGGDEQRGDELDGRVAATGSRRRSSGSARAGGGTRRPGCCRAARSAPRTTGRPTAGGRSSARAGSRAATTFRKLPIARPGSERRQRRARTAIRSSACSGARCRP